MNINRLLLLLNAIFGVRPCLHWVRDDECPLPRGHRTTHQSRPTFGEWWRAARSVLGDS